MKRTLTVCCAAHFLADFACAYLLFSALRESAYWIEILIVYNFCAFAVQMPLGVLADRWSRDAQVAAAGTVLTALAYAFPNSPFLVAAMVGIGNAVFHVGAGLEVLSLSEERAGPLGIFVAPGAVGLFLGATLGRTASLPGILIPLVLLAAAGGLVVAKIARTIDRAELSLSTFREVGLPLLLLLAVVVLRSFVGMCLPFPWKETGAWGLGVAVAVAAGKAAGGCLADRFGFMRTAALSLVSAALLLLFSPLPLLGMAAVLLFNMTMPLTLWAAARLLPQARGFAFGLLTFGLFLGFLPVAFGVPALSERGAAFWAVVSALLLVPALRKVVRR